MGNIYFAAPNGAASTSVAREQTVLATIPAAGLPVITPTYAGQVPAGSSILVQLGSTANITKAISGSAVTAARERAGQLREELGGHYTAIAPLWENRALVFLQYLERVHKVGKSFQVVAERLKAGEHTQQDISQLIGTFVNNSQRLKLPGATEAEAREKIRAYLARGEFDERMVEFLRSLDAKFEMLPGYVARVNELGELSSPEAAFARLEAAVEEYKAGNHSVTVPFLGSNLNLESRLEELLGTRGGSHFLLEAARMEEGEDKHALVVPVAYNRAANNPSYQFMPVERLIRMITLFDKIMLDAVDAYVQQTPELKGLMERAFIQKGFSEFNLAILLRAAFSPGHRPSAALYPDYRLDVNDPALKAAITDTFQSGRQGITGAALPKLGLEEGQFDFEEVVRIQSRMMEILPIQVYQMAAVDSQFKDPREALRHVSKYSTLGKMLLTQFQIFDRQLQRDFGITLSKKLFIPTQETLEDAAGLFGENKGLGFLKIGAQIMVTAP